MSKKRKSGFGKMFEVIWMDSTYHFDRAWYNSSHFKEIRKRSEDYPIKSTGYFLGKTKKTICMCSGITSGNEYGGIYTIPRGCIIRMRRIK
jgi:hypothetical protein